MGWRMHVTQLVNMTGVSEIGEQYGFDAMEPPAAEPSFLY